MISCSLRVAGTQGLNMDFMGTVRASHFKVRIVLG